MTLTAGVRIDAINEENMTKYFDLLEEVNNELDFKDHPERIYNVSEFEKRGNFAQNAIFCHFSTYHHFKPVRALGFRLGLLAVWAFYFTDPLEVQASLLSRAVSRQRGA